MRTTAGSDGDGLNVTLELMHIKYYKSLYYNVNPKEFHHVLFLNVIIIIAMVLSFPNYTNETVPVCVLLQDV